MKIEPFIKTITQLANKATLGMKTILSRNLIPPINDGGIISKTDLKITQNGTRITIESNFPTYAYWVEYGRRPGKMPPDKPIRDWVKRHNISEDAVFPIRRKIAKQGTTGKNFIEPLKRMIQMIKVTCLNFNVKYIEEDVNGELVNFKDITAEI